MFIFDPAQPSKPWHIWQGSIDQSHVMALCSKVFNTRPKGITVRGMAEVETICGLCVAKQQEAAA